MTIVRIDPEGRRNAEHIAIIVVVDLVPIQSHFRSRRPQAQQPLYQDGPTATGPAHDGLDLSALKEFVLFRNSFVVIIIIVRSHLGSSVRVACEGRLLTNDVRGFTNRDVD